MHKGLLHKESKLKALENHIDSVCVKKVLQCKGSL